MSLLSRLMHLVLALALVASGLAPVQPAHAAGPPAMAEAAVEIETPCHDLASEPMPPVPSGNQAADCCDPADCGCECLQHASTHLLARAAPVGVAPSREWAAPRSEFLPLAPGHALTRPPIG